MSRVESHAPAPAKRAGVRPVSRAGDRHEAEAERAADVVATGGSVAGWSFAGVPATAPVQRQEKPKSDDDKKKEALEKTAEAALETPAGKALKEKVLDDPLVKTVKDAATSTPGLIVGGAAIGGGLAALRAAKQPLPFQPPTIPLDRITPGLSADVKLEGPLNAPTYVGLTLTYKEQGPKQKPGSRHDKVAADVARLRREQEMFKPQAQKDAERRQEQEAVDAWIRRSGGLPGLTIPLTPGKPGIEEQPKEKKDEQPPVQRAAASAAPAPVSADVDDALASPGRPLEPAARRALEARFGRDFAGVRVHDDARAAATARAVDADAFTVGEDVVFASGRYDPGSASGRRLLAHELAHVVQQTDRRPRAGRPLDPRLRETFEARLGANLGAVRIHTDADAAAAARRLGARAYTVHDDVVFGRGEYDPDRPRGRWLLAHELAHVAQARRPQGTTGTQAVEHDASAAATAAVTGKPVRLGARRSSAQVHRFGEPDNVPELTFVSTSGEQGFLDQAVAFHRTWGLAPRRFSSLHDLLAQLARDTSSIARLRIVSHANFDNIFTPLFAGGSPGITEEDLLAYAESDPAGIRETLGAPLASDALAGQVVTAAGAADPAAFRALGVDPARPPATGAVARLLRSSVDLLLVRTAAGLPAAQRGTLTAALDTELAGLRTEVERTAPQGSGITAAQARALQDAVVNVTGFTFRMGAQPDRFVQAVGAATQGLGQGFRTSLDAVRRRLSSSTWVDIRGCRVGQRPAYLTAVSRFLGTASARPHVSGPEWFQSYPRLGWQTVSDATVAARAGDADVRAALEHWSQVTGIHDRWLWWVRFLGDVLRDELLRLATEPRPPGLAGGLRLDFDPLLAAVGGGGVLPLPPLREPTLGGRPRGPSLGTGPSLGAGQLRNPLVDVARRELPRYTGPAGELRYYLDASLPLPVQQARDVQDIALFFKAGSERAAIDAWLASQWSSAAPGLPALRSGSWARNELRQVEAVSDLDDRRNVLAMFVSPDPRYAEHIKTNP